MKASVGLTRYQFWNPPGPPRKSRVFPSIGQGRVKGRDPMDSPKEALLVSLPNCEGMLHSTLSAVPRQHSR